MPTKTEARYNLWDTMNTCDLVFKGIHEKDWTLTQLILANKLANELKGTIESASSRTKKTPKKAAPKKADKVISGCYVNSNARCVKQRDPDGEYISADICKTTGKDGAGTCKWKDRQTRKEYFSSRKKSSKKKKVQI